MEQTNEGHVSGIDNTINANVPNSTTNSVSTPSLRPIGELFSQTWSLTIKKYWSVLLIQLVPAIINIIIIICYVVAIFGVAGLFSVITKGDSSILNEKLKSLAASSAIMAALVLGIITVVITSIIFYIFQIWSYAAIIVEVNNSESKGVWFNYKNSWGKLLQYWWIGLMVGAAIFGGSILFIIPGIIFAVWFNYASFILFSENIEGTKAVVKSKQYVEGKWWDVFARMILLVVLALVVFSIVSFAANLIVSVLSAVFGNNLAILIILNILERIIIFVLTVLVLTFSYNYQFLIYQNLKEIKGQLGETKISNTAKWIYNGAPILLIILFLLIIVFGGYAIWFAVRNLNKYSSSLDNMQNIGNTLKENTNEVDLTSTSSTNNSPVANNVTDKELNVGAANLQTALETFYTVKGFYPYTEKIDALWTGTEKILDKPIAVTNCGEINKPSSFCGIYYKWVDKDNYQVITTHTDGEQSILTNTNNSSENQDQTKPTK